MSDGPEATVPHAATAAGADTATTTASTVAGARRPYRTPTLRHLGCVRDLALGGASGVAEGAGTFGPRKMM